MSAPATGAVQPPLRCTLLFAYPFAEVHLTKESGKIPEVLARDLGWRTEIVRCAGGPLPGREREIPHVRVRDLPGWGDERIEPAFLWYLLRHARRIDVLMLLNFGRHTAVYGVLYKLLNRRGFLWNKLDLHEEAARAFAFLPRAQWPPRTALRAWLESRFTQQADLITAESEGVRRELVERFPHLRDKYVVMPSGIDAATMPPPRPDAQPERIILNVARLGTHQKATDILLEAFARSELWRDWTLALVGSLEPGFAPWLASYAARHPAAWRAVRLVGPVASRQEMADWYARSRVFCLPSRYESWGIALTEAGYYGCACVASDFYAARDMLEDGRCGELCPKEDIAALAAALRRLCGDEARMAAHARRFQARVRALYTWDKIIADWHAAFLVRWRSAARRAAKSAIAGAHP